MSSASSSSLETRLRALELQVLSSSSGSSDNNNNNNVTARIEALERDNGQRLLLPSGGGAPLMQLWGEIDDLQEGLSPGTALTHQRQIVAPLLYRRQRILAERDALRGDLDRAAQILNLLLIGQRDGGGGAATKTVTEQQVVHAPILVETAAAAQDEEERRSLDRLAGQAVDLQRRAAAVSRRLDALLDHYARLVGAVSEKMVLLEEDLRRREAEKPKGT